MGKLDHEGEGAELRWAMSMRNAHGRYSLVRRARRTRRWVEPLDRSLICPIGLGQRQRQCCLRNRDRSCCRGGRWGGWRGWRHRTTIEDRNHREFETPRGAFNAERAMKQSVCSTETRFANSGVGGGLPPPQPNVSFIWHAFIDEPPVALPVKMLELFAWLWGFMCACRTKDQQ